MTTFEKEQIYRDYRDKVYGYIYGKLRHAEDAEDLCAEVFVKVYRNLDSFDKNKASLSTWIYTITRNIVIDFFRSGYANREYVSDSELLEVPVEEECRSEQLDLLADCLEELSQRERDMIVLHYYYGLPLKEVAEKMEMSYSNLRRIHKKALDTLKEKMMRKSMQ